MSTPGLGACGWLEMGLMANVAEDGSKVEFSRDSIRSFPNRLSPSSALLVI